MPAHSMYVYEKNLYFNNGLVDRRSVNIYVGTRDIRCRSSTYDELGETRNEEIYHSNVSSLIWGVVDSRIWSTRCRSSTYDELGETR
jgi:hypothetical protein